MHCNGAMGRRQRLLLSYTLTVSLIIFVSVNLVLHPSLQPRIHTLPVQVHMAFIQYNDIII